MKLLLLCPYSFRLTLPIKLSGSWSSFKSVVLAAFQYSTSQSYVRIYLWSIGKKLYRTEKRGVFSSSQDIFWVIELTKLVITDHRDTSDIYLHDPYYSGHIMHMSYCNFIYLTFKSTKEYQPLGYRCLNINTISKSNRTWLTARDLAYMPMRGHAVGWRVVWPSLPSWL